jgi:hypothetical protein
MPRGNPSPKLAITVDPDVRDQVVAAAVADWEAEHRALSEAELAAARKRVTARPAGSPRSA